jgi:hypothetical protein
VTCCGAAWPVPQGFLDEQLDRLVCLLRRRRIWALNVGENFNTTQPVSGPCWSACACSSREQLLCLVAEGDAGCQCLPLQICSQLVLPLPCSSAVLSG